MLSRQVLVMACGRYVLDSLLVHSPWLSSSPTRQQSRQIHSPKPGPLAWPLIISPAPCRVMLFLRSTRTWIRQTVTSSGTGDQIGPPAREIASERYRKPLVGRAGAIVSTVSLSLGFPEANYQHTLTTPWEIQDAQGSGPPISSRRFPAPSHAVPPARAR